MAGLVGGSAMGRDLLWYRPLDCGNRRAYRSPAQMLLKTSDYQVLSWYLLVVKTLVKGTRSPWMSVADL